MITEPNTTVPYQLLVSVDESKARNIADNTEDSLESVIEQAMGWVEESGIQIVSATPANKPVYLIERRSAALATLETVNICSSLDLVEAAIADHLKDGMEACDDVGDWHFCILEWHIDDLSVTSHRVVQRRDRRNVVI